MSQATLSTGVPSRPWQVAAAAVLALSVVSAGAARPVPALAVDGTSFVELANVKRASQGKAAVGWSSLVDTIAVERANAMAGADAMFHDMTYIVRRLNELGACYSGYGEIILWEGGYSSFSVQRAIDTWWNSTAHRAIMVGDYNAAGGSWAQAASGRRYAAMIFVKLCSPPPPPPPAEPSHVIRIAGGDRYATAAAVSQAHFSPGVAVAYVATGENYPDALSAGAVAGKDAAPLLLVRRNEVTPATATELARLRPGRIVVVGGSGVISEAVLDALRAYTAGAVTRLAGGDRYATAAQVSLASFGPGVAVAYLATGESFADALAGGAAAGLQPGPILLVRRDTIPDSTAAELTRLRPGRIVLLGGTGSISSGVASSVQPFTSGSVTRLAGSDRYATAVMVSSAHHGTASTVYVVTGQLYPDGLTATPPAVDAPGPVLLVRRDSLPSVVAGELARLNPDRVVILGGTGAVSTAVANAIDAVLD